MPIYVHISVILETHRVGSLSLVRTNEFFTGQFHSQEEVNTFLCSFEDALGESVGDKLCRIVAKEVAPRFIPGNRLIPPGDLLEAVERDEMP